MKRITFLQSIRRRRDSYAAQKASQCTPASRQLRIEQLEARHLLAAAEHFFGSDTLPPTNSQYVSAPNVQIIYANGVVLQNLVHGDFDNSFAPPALGNNRSDSFNSQVDVEASFDGGATFSLKTAPANVSVRVDHTQDNGATREFQTEMLALNLSGGNLPVGTMIRESPTLASLGQTTIRTVSGGFMIASFFDIFTEISVDGGMNWSPNTGNAAYVELMPVPAEIHGQKFEDVNGNGAKDAGELGLSDWTIQLDSGADGSVDGTATTDSNGDYSFVNLAPGVYRLREVLQSGWAQSTPNPADVTAVDGLNLSGVDFGNYVPGSIHGFKFEDLDSDGIYEPDCVAPDNGAGTATLPPADCDLTTASAGRKVLIVDGLPPGTTIESDARVEGTTGVMEAPGGNFMNGTAQTFQSQLRLDMRGTGGLAFNRLISLPVDFETHAGSRTPGQSVQSFDTDMFRMQGQITGDPDFDLLRITAGSDFGLPSPGHTTLTQRPGNNWAVDSFFDITYRIDFVGRPGGSLSGMSGSTTATIRMETGSGDTGLGNVQFQLTGTDGRGNPITPQTPTTMSNGEFSINGLSPGSYTVTEVVPSGSTPTTPTSFSTSLLSRQELVAFAGQAMLPPTVVNFNLSGTEEIPVNASTATGSCTGSLSHDQTSFQLTCTHNVANTSAAHIHDAAAGVNGPVVFPLSPATSPITATWDNSSGLASSVSDLLAGGLYVNVHSVSFPGGEIRGQIPAATPDPRTEVLIGQSLVFGNHQPRFDFGDAPDATGGATTGHPYPTLLEHDGARHSLGSGLFLGTRVDFEVDGQPTTGADGDDHVYNADGNLDGGEQCDDGNTLSGDGCDSNGHIEPTEVFASLDDEDGVTFRSGLMQGQTASVDVVASDVGMLNAWIDFDNDGSWADAGEQIFTDRVLTAGLNSLSFAVPLGTTANVATNIRFRLDTAGRLSFTGAAADGEVEDYQVTIRVGLGDKIGVKRGNDYLQDVNGTGSWESASDRINTFGNTTDTALVGDWDGDGLDEIGVHRGRAFYLDVNGNGVWDGPAGGDLFTKFGIIGDIPLIGDWNDDGIDDIGVQRGNAFYLDASGNGLWGGVAGGDLFFHFGNSGDIPVVGDWDGDGIDQLGIHRSNQFFLDVSGNGSWGSGDVVHNFGNLSDVPLKGDWDGDGSDEIGVKRGNMFYLDVNSNGAWNGAAGDLVYVFGDPSDRPLIGQWRPLGPLMAAGGEMSSSSDVAQLSPDALAPIVAQAIVLWTNSGLSPAQIQSLQRVSFSIADLPSAQLGLSLGGTIVLDADAAGYGWFIDPTPADDSEFDPSALSTSTFDVPHSMDLLSAVLHELGHELGLDHDDDIDAMIETLASGTRRLLQ